MTNDKSIVVLPFLNMSNDIEAEYFSDGMTEEIINALTTIVDLKVIARTSSFSFKGKNLDIRSIANQLNVSTVLEGSIRRVADRIRITVQFINAQDGSHFWSKNYERNLGDVFAIQDEISLLVAEKIRENFGHFEIPKHLVPYSHPIQAYDWYLKGLQYLKQKNFEDIKMAIQCFDKALNIDSNYADAYACIAESYIHYMGFSEMDTALAFQKIITNIDKALQINPNSGRAYKVKAYLKLFSWDWEGTKKAYQKAISNGLAPENEFISYYHIFVRGEKQYAIELAKKLLTIDPLHAFSHWQLGICYYFNKQFEDALQAFDTALVLLPEFVEALRWKGLVLGYLNKFSDAILFIEKAIGINNGQILARIDLMVVKILMGHREEVLNEIKQISFVDVCDSAMLYSLLDMPEKAIPLLEEGFKNQNIMLISLKHFFVWDNLRPHKAFNDLINQIDFPENKITDFPKKIIIKNLLSTKEIKQYTTILDKLMKEENLFTDAQLNLQTLAKYLEISANKLSWLFNTYYQKNFKEYLNQYRLAEFKRKVIEDDCQNLKLISIAYDCGFNSKTVFNTYFKKIEGITPKTWINNQIKN